MVSSFLIVLLGATSSLLLSIIFERLLKPAPAWNRPLSSWGLHIGLWCVLYALLVLLLGRPWFAAASLSFLMLLFVIISNVKHNVLNEPLVYQDYDYVIDIIKHPRLYIPFFGWFKTITETLFYIIILAAGLYLETPPSDRFMLSGQLGAILLLFIIGLLLLFTASRKPLDVGHDPVSDIATFGFLACFWHYGVKNRQYPTVNSPFNNLSEKPNSGRYQNGKLPHLVAVQSESFFDARCLYPHTRQDILASFDQLKSTSMLYGKLSVPAWGANTVRTEFSFLSGIQNETLGVHHFNPYRAIASGWHVSSLALYLKTLGYHTICIHPYPASFYQRKTVYPCLGFDEFIDIAAFNKKEHFGPYISDSAVADKVSEAIQTYDKPLFLFVITMENHGPLHLEKIDDSELDDLYTKRPPKACRDLSIYLRHLRNADAMIAKITHSLASASRPASLCWFGDHVPIMPSVYKALGAPTGETDFILWHSDDALSQPQAKLSIANLATSWLSLLKLI